MKPLEDITRQRSTVLEIAARHGARHVRIFGSVARGEAGPDSDLDVLVEMDSDRGLLDLVALERELRDLLGRPVDVVAEGGISPYLNDRIHAEAVAL